MDEYIKRSDVLALQRDLTFEGIKELRHYRVHHIDPTSVACIKSANVRHMDFGRWSCKRTNEHDGDWYCTACNHELTIYMGADRKDRYVYCPYCGAYMQ